MDLQIRRAKITDIPALNALLYQVHKVHSDGRPDLFCPGSKKYRDDELKEILTDDTRPIFVGVLQEKVVGYAFCIFQEHHNSMSLQHIKTLYIDDLCVDKEVRGQSIGQQLYQYVLGVAKESGCYNVTLNVWACNPTAVKFYERCGMAVQKIGMEQVL